MVGHSLDNIGEQAGGSPKRGGWFGLLAGMMAFVGLLFLSTSAAAAPAVPESSVSEESVTAITSHTGGSLSAEAAAGVHQRLLSDVHGPVHLDPAKRRPARVPEAFGTLHAGPVQIRYAPGLRGPASRLQGETQRIQSELRATLGEHVLQEPLLVVVAQDGKQMRDAAPEGVPPPGYAQGVAYPGYRLVLLSHDPVKGTQFPDLLEVYAHELSHIALRDALGPGAVPSWFNEGFSIYASGEAQVARLEKLWLATVGDSLLELSAMSRGMPANRSELAYAQSADIVRFILRRGEPHRFELLLSGVAKGRSFEDALYTAHGITVDELEREWLADAQSRFSMWPLILGSGTFWTLAVGLFGFAWWKRKRRSRVMLDKWTQEEEDERRRQIAQQLKLLRTHPQWLSPASRWCVAPRRRSSLLH